MSDDARQSVEDALEFLCERLEPLILERLEPVLEDSDWTVILRELDRVRGRRANGYRCDDLTNQLRVLTVRLGSLGYPFDDSSHMVSTLGTELKLMHGRWRRRDHLDIFDAYRTHDSVCRLLDALGDDEGADSARQARSDLWSALADQQRATAERLDGDSLEMEAEGRGDSDPSDADDVIGPSPELLRLEQTESPSIIGNERPPFQPWTVVIVGEQSELDELRRAQPREKLRSVVNEIVEFEGPIHIHRLAVLTARAFGVQRLRGQREKSIIRQIAQSGAHIDQFDFVWSSESDPETWREFRPNSSEQKRDFTEISPHEIANALEVLISQCGDLDQQQIDQQVLAAFGRRKKTKDVTTHLGAAFAIHRGR